MNKYQEALDLLFMWATNGYCALESDKDCAEYLTLKELLDKATPKKPIEDEIQDIRYVTKYTCPTCGGKFTGTLAKYCYHCGQRLDWNEDEIS